MQEVWEGKGDRKLIYKCGRTDTATVTTEPFQPDLPYTILKQFGSVCIEEKFIVLPYNVRLRIATVVNEWVKRSPADRFCAADPLVGSLTLMAHGTHQIYLSFDRFMNCKFDDVKLLKLLRCYKNCVPEPGTYFGEIVAQFFQHCKQQSNLNVKRTTRGPVDRLSTGSLEKNVDSIQSNVKEETVRPYEESVDTISQLMKVTLEKLNTGIGHDRESRETSHQRQDKPTADMDRKFEVIMSLKREATVVLMFMCTQKRGFSSNTKETLELYVKNKIFGTLVTADGENLLDKVLHEFSIKQFNNSRSSEIYFSLTVYRKNKYDKVLDDLLKSVDIYNGSIFNGVQHRLGVCTLIYCSDTLYFMGMSQSLFIENSVTFLYCFLTGKYRPVIESKEDSFVFGLVKILSSIEYFTESSLKRNHNGKVGHGPLTSVISEGGLNESMKYVNNMFRKNFLSETNDVHENLVTHLPNQEDYLRPNAEEDIVWDPKSPSYAPESPPSTLGGSKFSGKEDLSNIELYNKAAGATDARRYVINEPYINTFLNRPVECGSMY